MKKILSILFLLVIVSSSIKAQWPSEVRIVDFPEGDSTVVSGNLADGKLIEDLSWAYNSSNACFVGYQGPKFRGNHTFFATRIPPRTEIIITVIPENDTANMSMYAYMVGKDSYPLVPKLYSCITCEADYKWDRKWKGKTQTHERYVKLSNPSGNTYNILVGVSAPAGVIEGAFDLIIKR